MSGTTFADYGQVLADHTITEGIASVYHAGNNGHIQSGSDTLALLEDANGFIAGVVLEPETGYAGAGRVYVNGSFHTFTDGAIDIANNRALWQNIIAWATCCDAGFQRGDCNVDGASDIADPIYLLGYLFADGPVPSCDDACDGNDDGALDIGDVIGLLSAFFTGGEPPPAPYPDCGDDPTADGLDCASFAGCP